MHVVVVPLSAANGFKLHRWRARGRNQHLDGKASKRIVHTVHLTGGESIYPYIIIYPQFKLEISQHIAWRIIIYIHNITNYRMLHMYVHMLRIVMAHT